MHFVTFKNFQRAENPRTSTIEGKGRKGKGRGGKERGRKERDGREEEGKGGEGREGTGRDGKGRGGEGGDREKSTFPPENPKSATVCKLFCLTDIPDDVLYNFTCLNIT
jgi:hypothetical protein